MVCLEHWDEPIYLDMIPGVCIVMLWLILFKVDFTPISFCCMGAYYIDCETIERPACGSVFSLVFDRPISLFLVKLYGALIG